MSDNITDTPPVFKKERAKTLTMPRTSQSVAIAGISLLALIAGLLTFKSIWRNVRPGHIGILFDKASHQVAKNPLEPGWAILNPINQDLQEYPVTIQTYSMVQKGTNQKAQTDGSVKVQSSEGQQLNLDVVVQYQVRREEANQLYQDLAGAPINVVEERVVEQFTRSQVPLIAAKYSWQEIISTKRGVLATEIAEQLSQEFQKRHLQLISVGIRDVHLPPVLQKALDAKLQAQQSAEQAQIKAVEAEGEAAAIRVRAKAQAEANEILSRSLTAELIRYQQLQKWDGKLPLFSGSGVTPLVNTSEFFSGSGQSRANKP